jgi:hypothetical protein
MCGRRGDCKQLFVPNEKGRKAGANRRQKPVKKRPRLPSGFPILLVLVLLILSLRGFGGSGVRSRARAQEGGAIQP